MDHARRRPPHGGEYRSAPSDPAIRLRGSLLDRGGHVYLQKHDPERSAIPVLDPPPSRCEDGIPRPAVRL
jgi:hypothetical protein